MGLRAGDARMFAMEVQNLHNDTFYVEQVARKPFGDQTKIYFNLQERACTSEAPAPKSRTRCLH
jgi:hypothetical protein